MYKHTTPQAIEDFNAVSERVKAMQKKRAERLKSEKKAKISKKPVAVVIIILVALIFGTMGIVMSNAEDNSRLNRAYSLPLEEVVVEEGDTIDSIASRYPVDGLNDHELGSVIADINAAEPPLYPGEILMVPKDE